MDSLMKRTLKQYLASLEPPPENEQNRIRHHSSTEPAIAAVPPLNRGHTVPWMMLSGTGIPYSRF